MGSKILYMLPALVLAFLALVLALVGLSRDPEPVTVTSTETSGQADQEQAAPSYEYWVLRQPMNAGDTLVEDSLAVVTSPTQITDALSAEEAVIGRELRRYARPGELLIEDYLERATEFLDQDDPAGALAELSLAAAQTPVVRPTSCSG